MKINAKGIHYRELNKRVRSLVEKGERVFRLVNINGQRYIGEGLDKGISIGIEGVPGNDLAGFMNGAEIEVFANGQDGIGNTMNAGRVIIHGDVGDIVGHGMRGGEIYIKGDVGYRVGIHMKEYKEKLPVVIAGGRAGNFLGEYMAGGVLIILGLNRKNGEEIAGRWMGTGMHGGVIYLRGKIDSFNLGREAKPHKLTKQDETLLSKHIKQFCKYFKMDFGSVYKKGIFAKFAPTSSRPYGNMYAY